MDSGLRILNVGTAGLGLRLSRQRFVNLQTATLNPNPAIPHFRNGPRAISQSRISAMALPQSRISAISHLGIFTQETLPMIGSNKLRERIEFSLAFLLSMMAGLMAFLFVWVLGAAWECYRG